MEGRESAEVKNLLLKEWERHIEDGTRPLAELFMVGEMVEEMTKTPGWGEVESLLERLRQQRLDVLIASRQPLGEARYAQQLAFVDGLNSARNAAKTIVAFARQVERQEQQKAEATSGG